MTDTAVTIDVDQMRETIAANVAAEIKRQRWTGRSASVALGLTQAYVYRRLAGEVEMSGSDLAMFAKFLSVPVQKFFEEPTTDYGYEVSPVIDLLERIRPAVENDREAVVTELHQARA